VYWNRRYGAAERRLDEAVKTDLRGRGIDAASFNGHLLHEPWTLTTGAGGPYRVFSAYWRAAARVGPPAAPRPVPMGLVFEQVATSVAAGALKLTDLQLRPTAPDWAHGMRSVWPPGEDGARQCLERFLGEAMPAYAAARDRPDQAATSRMSPYLRFGNISPRQVWHAAAAADAARSDAQAYRSFEKFQSELGWREFSYHLLFHNPDLASRNLQAKFDRMPWRRDAADLQAWQKGQTGYPLVDAGMRELWTTGWMHNRVRMVVASFLVKHLLLDWREGEAWFWDTLVDADPASNPASWQWVAGCGADAAPYFRIFNPVLQGEKFDPEGVYVKRWVPELAQLPDSVVHSPWDATPAQLRSAGVILGKTYPERVVEHQHARQRALAALSATSDIPAG
jgi:deoxyribodipyrimidine photo-lyase